MKTKTNPVHDARTETLVEELLRRYFDKEHEERGDAFATDKEFAAALQDPLALMDLLHGHDAGTLLRDLIDRDEYLLLEARINS